MAKSGPGFVKVYDFILEQAELSMNDKLVFSVVLDQIEWKGQGVQVGQRLLAKLGGTSKGVVQRSLLNLERAG